MANAAWKKLKAALGDGFEVPEPVQQMPEMDLTEHPMEMPEMDLSHPEEVTKTRPLVKGSRFQVPAEMRMPTMDLSKPEKVMEMPAMDLRPGAVDAGEMNVSDADIEEAALKKWADGDHGDAFGDKPAPQVPGTETLVARQGGLISPDDPEAAKTSALPPISMTSWGSRIGSPRRDATPDRSKTKALLAKAKKPAGSADPLDPANFPPESGLNPGLSESALNSSGNAEEGPRYADAFPPEDSTGVAAVRRPLAPRPGSVPAQVGAAVTGATPPQQSELELAQQRARAAEREAQYAHGMGGAADIISGTHYNEHAGEDIRAAGQQGVKDVLEREQQGLRAAGEGRAVEDQTFQRSAEQRAQGADQRAQQGFATQQGEFDANSSRSKGARANLVARYPHIAKRIPPDQFATMSEHDVKMLMGELPETAAKGAGGAGGAAEDKEVLQRVKMIPKNAKGIYDMLDNLDGMISAAGGLDKIEGVGGFMGMAALRPGMTMNPQSQAFRQLRQQISNMSSNQLFGSALSPTEAGRFDKAISDVASGNTAEQVMGGMRVVREMTKSAYEQSQAGISPGARQRIEKDIGGLAQPLGPRPEMAPRPKMVRLKNGELVEQVD